MGTKPPVKKCNEEVVLDEEEVMLDEEEVVPGEEHVTISMCTCNEHVTMT